jgi:RNA polymerase-binding protein DksA
MASLSKKIHASGRSASYGDLFASNNTTTRMALANCDIKQLEMIPDNPANLPAKAGTESCLVVRAKHGRTNCLQYWQTEGYFKSAMLGDGLQTKPKCLVPLGNQRAASAQHVLTLCAADFLKEVCMQNKHFEDIRRRLVAERQRVLESFDRNTRYALSEFDDTTRDAGDLASVSHDRGLLYRLQEADAKRLKAIDEVLSGIGRGEYGICQQCGEEIAKSRLEALPWAVTCVPCQEEADRREAALAGSGLNEKDVYRAA